MKEKLTILFLFSSLILVVSGVINYNLNGANNSSIYEELGSIEETEYINLREVYKNFGIKDSLNESESDFTVIYLTDYSECANTVTEIKEFSNILDSLRRHENLVINEAFLLLDNDSLRAKREIKILNLTISSGYYGFNFDSNKLMRFGENEIATNQIIFVDKNQRIRFRNKLSGIIDIPITDKEKVVDLGIRYTLADSK